MFLIIFLYQYIFITYFYWSSIKNNHWFELQLSTAQARRKGETSTPNKFCWECRVNDDRPTGEKNTTIEWDNGGKIGNKNKLILTEIFISVHETWYLKVFIMYYNLLLMRKENLERWKDKKLVKWGERRDIYLSYVCRLLWSIESLERMEKKNKSFQPAL